MGRKLFIILVFPFFLLIACSNNAEKQGEKMDVTQKTTIENLSEKKENSYKVLQFDSKYDLVCGMPISAGLSDTAHFEQKLFGFCSSECKDEFKKDPKTYIATIKKVKDRQ